jgi:thiosulfate dehydrogenase (quinone) large subunit
MDKKSWFVMNARLFTKLVEVLFGLIFLSEASLKLQPGFAENFNQLVAQGAAQQPAWTQAWFHFWITMTGINPVLCAYIVIIAELGLAVTLILGLMRKVSYFGGAIYGMLIWSIPEGFGGPFGPGSTNMGVGIIYTVAFLLLIALDAAHRDNYYTLDMWIEKRIGWWRKLAEFGK